MFFQPEGIEKGGFPIRNPSLLPVTILVALLVGLPKDVLVDNKHMNKRFLAETWFW